MSLGALIKLRYTESGVSTEMSDHLQLYLLDVTKGIIVIIINNTNKFKNLKNKLKFKKIK